VTNGQAKAQALNARPPSRRFLGPAGARSRCALHHGGRGWDRAAAVYLRRPHGSNRRRERLSPASAVECRYRGPWQNNGSSVARPLRKIHFDIKLKQALEQRSLAIIIPRPELGVRDLFATVLQQSKPQQRPQDFRLQGKCRPVPSPRQGSRCGMVYRRANLSLVCQLAAETDSDHSTIPMSACGHEPSRPRPKYSRSMRQNII
jgi:hypothetical protein